MESNCRRRIRALFGVADIHPQVSRQSIARAVSGPPSRTVPRFQSSPASHQAAVRVHQYKSAGSVDAAKPASWPPAPLGRCENLVQPEELRRQHDAQWSHEKQPPFACKQSRDWIQNIWAEQVQQKPPLGAHMRDISCVSEFIGGRLELS